MNDSATRKRAREHKKFCSAVNEIVHKSISPAMALDPNRVYKPVKKLRKMVKRIRKQPLPEQVHDLRTNTRRLEATMTALSLDSRRNARKLLKDLSRIRKRAGKVRDMDVLTACAATIDAGEEQDCKVQLLEHLGAERRKLAKNLHTTVAKNAQPVRRRLKQFSDEIDRFLCLDEDHACDPAKASAQAAAAALALSSELATTPARLGRQNLHPYRLKVKELRNVLRMAKGDANKKSVETLGTVKGLIGEWHDWEELLATAQPVLDHGSNCRIIRELKKIANDKYEQALAAAKNMRRKYLRKDRDLHRGNKVRLRSVPAAITAMAA
jgi:CHAD domain-containing protein